MCAFLCVGSLFCDVVPSVLSSFDEEERTGCFISSCSCSRLVVSVPSLFLAVLLVGLWCVIVAFPGHTNLLF